MKKILIFLFVLINYAFAYNIQISYIERPPAGNKRYIICSKGVDQEVIDKINLSIQKFVKLPSF